MTDRERRTSIVAMLVLPLAAIGLFGRNVRTQIAAPPAAEVIEGPDTWVAFVANMRLTHPGEPPIHGRFFRSSNGSDRLESGPSIDDIRVVFIRNVPERTLYSRNSKDKTWTRQPWEPQNGGNPPIARKLSNWSLYPYRLAIRRGESGATNAATGFVAYSVVTPSNRLLKVPALNFFDVVRQRQDGRYEAYTDIELIDPPADVFVPPLGAVVRDRQPPSR